MNTDKVKIYKSEAAEKQLKKKMTKLVIIFVIAMLVLPCILGFIFSFVSIMLNTSALFSADIRPIVAHSMKKDGEIFTIAKDSDYKKSFLVKHDINSKEGFKELKQLKSNSKLTMDNQENILIVSKKYYEIFPNEPVELSGIGNNDQEISSLFWLRGELYSICLSNDSKSSKIFWLDRKANEWKLKKEVKHYQVTQIIYSPLSVIEYNSKIYLFLFYKENYKLLYQVVDNLEQVDELSWEQFSMSVSRNPEFRILNNKLVLFISDNQKRNTYYIKGYQLKDGKWEEFFKSENFRIIIGYQIFLVDSGINFSIIVNNYPGSYKYQEFKDGDKILDKTIGVSPFEYMKFHMISGISINLILFLLIIICLILISRWIEENRYLEIKVQGKKFNSPTLKRRASAKIIDWLISDLICFLIVYLIADFDDVSFYNLFSLYNIIFVYMTLKLFFFFIFILLEAYTGKTPGKYLTKIKVVDYSGENIGLKKSILRNLLRIVDQMFYGIIGIYFVTFSDKFQRLGDKVADTIVIKE